MSRRSFLSVFFLIILSLHLARCYPAVEVYDNLNDTLAILPLEPIQITYPTFDRRLNLFCNQTSDVYWVPGLSNTIACIIEDIPFLYSPTADVTTTRENPLRFVNVNVIFAISNRKKIIRNVYALDQWWTRNKTCEMPFADSTQCRLSLPSRVRDSTIVRKKCYFVHGVGESGGDVLMSSFPQYWGDVQTYMPQCLSANFLWMDTRSRSFDSPDLLKKVCQLITNTTVYNADIVNSYIYTHSMGGLIMTQAVLKGFCTINTKSSRIYMSSPPLNGSMTARYVDGACKGAYGDLIQTVARSFNYCMASPGTGAWPAYKPMDPSNPELKSIYYGAGIYSNGFLCGDCNITDLFCGNGPPWETAALKSIAVISNLEYPNDGMVSLGSCNSPFIKSPLVADPTRPFYRGQMNHADSSCRNGDSVIRNAKPCYWFSNLYEIQ